MTQDKPVLTFAVVGHPNEGKSSVVSTLTEDDSVRITPIPGETVVCRAFPVLVEGREMACFVDTPGFQSPHATLEWFKAHPGPDMLAGFIREHAKDARFHAECELFKPLVEGSEIIYVLDASRPLRSVDIAEMEILRMTGIPRMAIINAKEHDENFVGIWRDELRKHFNAVRVFNALRATYAERIALLNSLKSIDQEWEDALGQVIAALEKDWRSRLTQSAAIITDMITQALTRQISQSYPPGEEPRDLLQKLSDTYQQDIIKLENQAHERIRKLFKHNIFDYRLPEQIVPGEDLFQERTWRMLGLSPVQVAAAGAVAGGGIGLGLDAAVGGSSLGAFALAGGILGAGTAIFGGRRMLTYEVKGPRLGPFRLKKPLGDYLLSVGPNKNTQFPFILLDRALIFFAQAINWAHARREPAQKPEHTPSGFVARLSQAQTRTFQKYFQAARDNDENQLQMLSESMKSALLDVLMRLSGQKT